MPASNGIILASGSPRRRQLLQTLGIAYRVLPADLDERQLADEGAAEFALRAARDKALAVAATVRDMPVLGSDTVVDVDGIALGKPATAEEASEMLWLLSGRSHLVHTGIALVFGDRCESLIDTATVRFRTLDDALIQWYVSSGEPMDKAGAYAVQERGGLLVECIEGAPNTVIGLPLHRLPELFARLSLDFWNFIDGS